MGGGGGGGGLILCLTLYATKLCAFFTTKMQFFERELFQNRYKQYLSRKKGDVNKGISVHKTTLLLHWTNVHNGMLFHGPLPLELNRDLQWMQWVQL